MPATRHANWYDTQVITFDSQQIMSTTGMSLSATVVDNLSAFDTVIIPGWSVNRRKVKLNVAESIVDFASHGKRLISFCSGAFLLGYLGLLNGKQVTTHWCYAELFAAQFPHARYDGDVLFTQQDNIYCSAGSAAALDLCIEVVRQDWGASMANHIARRLVVSAHRQGGQVQFVERPVDANSKRNAMGPLLDWIIERIDQPIPIDALAKRVNMSRRTFDRKFRAQTGVSPKVWLNQQRVMIARELLEQGEMNIEQVAQSVGFENAITLRFNFKKLLSVSPTDYQRQFQKQC